jgi:cysteine desulfurase
MDHPSLVPSANRYFDNAATTPLDPRVLKEMLPFLGEAFGNANSIHAFGQRAHAAVELARLRVATLIGAEDPSQIVFVSGATEANNQVLRSFSKGIVSPFEHSAVREPARNLGWAVLKNEGLKLIPPDERHDLVSVMLVNNEIGSMWPPPEFRNHADFVHSDMTQGVGKLPINLDGIDFASFSAHKFYGPKGVGAVYFRDTPPDPLIRGGEQEHDLRGGTLNVAGIVGMGLAAEIARSEMDQNLAHATELRSVFLDGLSGCTDCIVNGGERVSPYILSISFLGVEGETLVIEADKSGYAISSGAACSSHSNQPSHVLAALELSENWSRGTVRISFGKYATIEAASGLGRYLRQTVENLRTFN